MTDIQKELHKQSIRAAVLRTSQERGIYHQPVSPIAGLTCPSCGCRLDGWDCEICGWQNAGKNNHE